jgi:hypothetical protein
MIEMTLEEDSFKTGASWRSYLVIIYAIGLFSPAIVWLSLVTIGAQLTGAITLSTLILCVELARMSGKPLTKQEAFTIQNLVGTSSMTGLFTSFIYAAYFTNRSPISKSFGFNLIAPSWFAPAAGSLSWELRTFLSTDWILPISVGLIATMINSIGGIALGLLARELLIEVENLPFPMTQVQVTGLVTLVEREKKSYDLFSISTVIGLFYGLALYTFPSIGAAIGIPIQVLPIPWFDFTSRIENYLPGASFGIATDLMMFAGGFVIPFSVVIGLFMGSFSVYVIGNWLMVHFGLGPWGTHWTHGMSFQRILADSSLYFWVSPLIGIGLAIGLIPVAMRFRSIVQAFRGLIHPNITLKRRSGTPVKVSLLLFLWMSSAIVGVIFLKVLCPDYPIWILILFSVIFPLLTTLISARMVGITGISFGLSVPTNLIIWASGYQGTDLWFAPAINLDGTGWCTTFKGCQLTKTKWTSYIKIWLIGQVIAAILSFVVVSAFWSMAPIPSSVYPGAAAMWPLQVISQSVWISSTSKSSNGLMIGSFVPSWIFYSALIASALFILGLAFHLPFPAIISYAGGLSTPIPMATSMLIGAMIGIYFEKKYGRLWWNKYKMNIAAGFAMGEGISVIIGTAIAMGMRATWYRPF